MTQRTFQQERVYQLERFLHRCLARRTPAAWVHKARGVTRWAILKAHLLGMLFPRETICTCGLDEACVCRLS